MAYANASARLRDPYTESNCIGPSRKNRAQDNKT